MAGDNTTKKAYRGYAGMPMEAGQNPKKPSHGVQGPKYTGQMRGEGGMESFAEPMQAVSAQIRGLSGTYNDIGEVSGFITDGYLDKQGTPYGEAAKFNYLPPGMDISNQMNAEIHDMPMRKLVAESYPGDGWMPTPRDVME